VPPLVRRNNARQWQRVKPDPETNPLADLDCEKIPRWNEPLVTTPLLHLGSGRTDCIVLVTQPLAIFERPTETDRVAAM
jgi:hypothetical protein